MLKLSSPKLVKTNKTKQNRDMKGFEATGEPWPPVGEPGNRNQETEMMWACHSQPSNSLLKDENCHLGAARGFPSRWLSGWEHPLQGEPQSWKEPQQRESEAQPLIGCCQLLRVLAGFANCTGSDLEGEGRPQNARTLPQWVTSFLNENVAPNTLVLCLFVKKSQSWFWSWIQYFTQSEGIYLCGAGV